MKNVFNAVLLLFVLLNIAYGYTVHIAAPAVLENVDRGVLTSIYLNVTSGTGVISVSSGGTGSVGNDTVASADTAVAYAVSYLNLNKNNYNFAFVFHTNDSNVSGPSAGLAMTLLTIAGLEHQQLNSNFTVTGTINSNGTVGQIGGVFDKVQAAKSINAKYILVPYLSKSNYQYLYYYLSQQAYGVPVIQVQNVSQAVPYAIGNPVVTPMTYTLYKDYSPSGLPVANATCASCNDSAFQQLMNFTFNFTQTQINNINSTKFSAIKLQLQSQLAQYYVIGSKGYMYSSADLAFNEYPTAFVFSNYNTANYASAQSTLSSITAYCNSVNTPPQLTTTNYEYVFGGEARMEWAQQTLNAAYAELNVSQTSDDILLILQTAAPAYSWCLAAGQMYNIGANMGGSPVMLSSAARYNASSAVQNAQQYGSTLLYVNASKQAYLSGEYGAAIYSAEYAKIFYNDSNLAYPNAVVVNATVTQALSSPNGIWPQQFALQSRFYLYQASLANNTTAPAYLNDAYTTALLSEGIGNVNSYLQSNFVPAAVQPQNMNMTSQFTSIQSDISLIIAALIIVILLLAIIIIILILHITKTPAPNKEDNLAASPVPRTRAKTKTRRTR